MKFEIFSKLYAEALMYKDVDMYIAERGWQDWMDEYTDSDDAAPDASAVCNVLNMIYDLAHMDIKQMRTYLRLTFKGFSERYSIPSRTVQDWEYGKNKTPKYMLELIAYTIFTGGADEQN